MLGDARVHSRGDRRSSHRVRCAKLRLLPESVEVVSQFFSDAGSFEQELKRTYAARRKDARRGDDDSKNNW